MHSKEKLFAIISLFFIVISCRTQRNTISENTDINKRLTFADFRNSNDEGLKLLANSDCITCHKLGEKLIGPAFIDVSYKYAGVDTAVEHLSNKIINGGYGVWGIIPMIPHHQLAKEDVEKIVKFILSLKNQQTKTI